MASGRIIFLFITFAIIAILLAGGGIYYIAFTTKGSDSVIRPLLSRYVETESTSIKKTTGNLSEALIYQDIEFRDPKWLPQGNLLKIQRLEIALNSFSLEGLNIKIHNGKLKFSGSDAILFYGEYQNRILNITVYSKEISVRDVLDLFSETAALKKVSGTLGDVDINIKGPLFDPEIYGSFNVEKLTRNGFSMTNCPGEVKLQLKDIKDDLKLNGQILLKSGVISGPKTAVINLKESKILFAGEPKKPMLDIKGLATVENININIILKGTFDRPELTLSCKPSMDQDRLLLMVATNKTWQSVETAVSKQKLSADVVKDFLDYFIFSGSGNRIAERYGIRDILVKYDKTTVGIGATKDISEKAAISYSVEQPQQKTETPITSHKIGGEYKITENVIVGAEKGLKQNSKTGQIQDKEQTDDKITMKFKKEF